MTPPEDRFTRWRDRRARKLSGLRWLRADQGGAGQAPVWYVAGEMLVRTDHVNAARQVLAESGHGTRDVAEEEDVPAGFRRYRGAELDVAAAVREIRRRAERAGDARPAASPNHVFLSAPFEHGGPFGPPRPVGRPPELPLALPGTRGTGVAVVDTGVWRDSPLPAGSYEADPDDFESDVDVDDDGVIDGDVGHANFIAGVIIRRTVSARVRVIRTLDTFGVCTEAELVTALGRVTNQRLVNLSLGGFTLDDQPPLVLRDALATLMADPDRVVVAAAGNDGQRDRPFWPAAFAGGAEPWRDRVVAVAAHDGSQLCPWSNTGDWVTLAAPGADVTSTYVHHKEFDTGWAQWSGTSFATPYALGTIAAALDRTGGTAPALRSVLDLARQHRFGRYPGLP